MCPKVLSSVGPFILRVIVCWSVSALSMCWSVCTLSVCWSACCCFALALFSVLASGWVALWVKISLESNSVQSVQNLLFGSGQCVSHWMSCFVSQDFSGVRFCAVCRKKTPLAETVNQGPPCIHTCMHAQPKHHTCRLQILRFMSEFSGLWKQQKGLACT